MSERQVSLVVALAGGIAFVVLAVLLVPWHPVPWEVVPVSAREVFSSDEIARAEHYARWARAWSWGGLVVTLVAFALLARSAGRGRLAGWLDRLPDRGWLRSAVVVVLVMLVVWLVGLPWLLAGWWLRREVGLSVQPVGGVLLDGLRWQVMSVLATVAVVLAWRWLVRRLPRAWPAAGAAAAAALTLALSFAWPLVVEPVFNDFRPLADGPLRSSVLATADREGVPVDDVLVSDASSRTNALNAYVSGFGATRRVVLYDTLVEREPTPVVVSVAAHELAHAKYDDPWTGSLLGAAGAAAGVGALGLLLSASSTRHRWGAPASPGAVALTLALVAFATVVTAPLSSGISRQVETRADVTALETTADPATFERLQVRLAVANLSDPTPPRWSQWMFGTHPTAVERIAVARGSTARPVQAVQGR